MSITFDVAARRVDCDGAVTLLSEREAAVLGVLASGKVVSRTELIRHADLGDLSARRCESVIMNLRRILGPDSIVNLRRRGWRLVAETNVIT